MADLCTVLLDGSLADPALLGGKGAWLARLVGWGLPVPTTGVVTSEGFRSAFEAETIGGLVGRIRGGEEVTAEEVDATFLSAPLDLELVAEIQSLARRVGGGNRIAVRSSATAEDMKQVSFAGQYRSFLDVDPADGDAVVGAVKLVFASLWHPAPVAYRRSFAVDESAVAMAAVMMAMVPARRAGVVFTIDPAGDGSTARIETVEGLADSLVSGRVTPVVTVLPRAGPAADAAADAPPDVARALALALEVEALAGTPQDVEWASDGDTVWLVQARPITTQVGDTGDGFDDPAADLATLDLTTAGIGEMLPGVLAPLQWDIGSHLVEEAMRSTFAALGVCHDELVARRGLVRRVRGRAAMDFGLLARMAAQLPRADIDQLEEQYFGSRRPGRAPAPSVARRGRRLAAARHDIRVLSSRRRAELDAELVILTSAGVADAATDLTALDDGALLAYWLRLIDVAVRAMTAEMGVAANAAAAYRRLELALGGVLGPIEAGRAAIRLTIGAAVAEPPDDRASAAVFAGPTWRELGQSVASAASAVRRNDGGEEGADPVAELRQVLKDVLGRGGGGEGLRATMRMRVAMRAMEDAVAGLARRERTKAAVLLLGGEVRRVHLEAGRRLNGRGLLPEPGDVDLMSAAELRAALLGTYSAPTPDVFARRRRALHRYQLAGPLPARFVGAHDRESVEVPSGRRLEGWAVSPGRHTGRAQVVSSPSDPFDADSVLVAVATDPSWSPLFARAGAVVLERGGPLSHAAILARELGLPAFTNVGGATSRLDGREVMVDGDSGIVVVTGEEP